MKKILFLFLFVIISASLYAEQQSKIELKDGSVINGEIVSFSGGAYTINTPALGQIRIEEKKVLKIEPVIKTALPNNSTQTSNSPHSQVSAYGQELMKDAANEALINELASNPKLKGMANDPQMQKAAEEGDIQALLSNPKFMDIVNSPEMQDAIKKIKK